MGKNPLAYKTLLKRRVIKKVRFVQLKSFGIHSSFLLKMPRVPSPGEAQCWLETIADPAFRN